MLFTRRPARARATRLAGRLAVFVGGAAVLLTGAATPAAAHGADAPAATDYRVTVTGTVPAVDGLTVRVVEAGARLELTNHSGRPIEVLGYAGEPYLEIRPDGVYQNRRSPTAYQNETLAGDTPVPADADPTAPPLWRRIADRPVVRWHDQRTYWRDAAPPDAVRAAPDQVHRVRDWVVPLRDGVTPVELRGTLDWIPPPDPLRWWGGTLLGAVLMLVALLATARRGPRTAQLVSAGGLAVGAATAVGYAMARAVESGTGGPLGLLSVLLDGPVWALLTGLAALAAAGYAARRRPGAELALALTGTCLAIFAGVANAAVFTRAIAPVPGPAWWPRIAVAAVLVSGAAVALGAVLRLRAEPAAGPDGVGRAGGDGPGGAGPDGGELTRGEPRVEAER
ncbi:hypothetical protein EDC02_0099 [Micromonospora sp. Llam0]|uniref:hypothetical protein n=1 Tax=Micromonospora sp. Llam0 TaxID=2485143 RepID=UPI000FBBFD0E|nr:hypothetical protein [Micromonospora sp. Llam0]ROO58351.1 hypothetical protein EDC02_0099 [Micromonospora sp. Llam0]